MYRDVFSQNALAPRVLRRTSRSAGIHRHCSGIRNPHKFTSPVLSHRVIISWQKEHDFIINYDIKYRMGQEAPEEVEE